MKLVILDSDGTINVERDGFVQTADDWQPLPGALEAIARLNHAGYQAVIAANMPGLGRGLFDMAAMNAIQAKMNRQLAAVGGRVEAVFFCPHAPDDGCTCRKPLPGLMQQIGERYKVDLHQVHAVGDSVRDAQAAAAAGCTPHLVLTGKSAPERGSPLPPGFPPGTRVHVDLTGFVNALIGDTDPMPLDEAPPPAPV